MTFQPQPSTAPITDEAYMGDRLAKGAAVIAETFPRTTPTADQAVLATAQLFLYAIPFVGGQAISNITFVSGTTALNTGANQWFALYNQSRKLLAVTADDTSTAWAANTAKTLALAAAFTPQATEWGYVGIMVKATTPPTLTGVAFANTIAQAVVPILGGASTTTLTNPASAPATAGAITVAATMPYAYLS